MAAIQYIITLNRKKSLFPSGILKSILILGTIFLILQSNVIKAQGLLGGQNLSTLNIDNLSDDQIRQLIAQAQSAGLSQSQLEQMALSKGLPADQLQKLEARIAKISRNPDANTNLKEANNSPLKGSGRNVLRSSEADSLNDILKQRDQVFDKIKVKVFGEDLFNNPKLTFEPNLRIPTPQTYVLGPDDQILVDIYGYSEANYKLNVSPEGFIRIPNVGPVFVNGLSISAAKAKILKSLQSVYTGLRGNSPNTFLNISLGDIRSIKVVLIGEVRLPGTYTLPSLATVFNALYSSGGPNPSGSFRNIELIRNNKVVDKIDIYDFLINGVQKQNVRLEDQDVIKVNPYQSRVEFQGEVKRPGIYEVKPGESLNKLLEYAAGFTDRAYTHRIKIIQTDSREKNVKDIDDAHYSSYLCQRGDLYIVEPIINRFSNRVQIKGSVFRPGIYALENGLTLSQLIKKADGIKEDAFTSRATIRRLNEKLMPEYISFDVNRILNGQDNDIPLMREDSITISSRKALQEAFFVSIEGEVLKPDTTIWASGMHLQDLILHAGGLTDAASFKRIEVTRRVKDSDPLSPNSVISKSFRFDITEDLKSNSDVNNFLLEPFDHIVVRTLPGYSVQQYANIDGEVLYRGKYGITQKNMKISDLIKLSGGLTLEAFPQGATLIRTSVQNRSDQDKKRQLLVRLRAAGRDSSALAKVQTQIDSLSHIHANPVGIDLVKILKNPGSKYDLILNDGDSIKIPRKLETVQVNGDVLYSVSVRYDKSYNLLNYINAAGGFSSNAAKHKTYVVYANGSVSGTHSFLFIGSYPKILPGAQIVVPDKGTVKKTSLAEYIGIGSTLSSLALLLYTIFKL